MATKWEVERCCRDRKCPGSWFAINRMTNHIADSGDEYQGVWPSKEMAQEWCDKANEGKLPVTKA